MALASKEVLKNGKILNELINRFIKEPNGANLAPIFRCLIDSDLYVPMNMDISEKDIEQFNNVNIGDEIELLNDIKLKPDWLNCPDSNEVFFPIFSTLEEVPKEYHENFTWINMSLDNCVNFIDNNKECIGLVLNAFTTPIEIKKDLYDILKKMLIETRNKENNT